MRERLTRRARTIYSRFRGPRSLESPGKCLHTEGTSHYTHCSANNATPPTNLFDSRAGGKSGEWKREVARQAAGCGRERGRNRHAQTYTRRKERKKASEIANSVPRVPMVLMPTFESTPPFTIRPNYPSGNPFHPSLTFPRCFTTANYTYLRPRAEESRDWILVNSLLFRLRDERYKGSGRVFFSPCTPSPVRFLPFAVRLINRRDVRVEARCRYCRTRGIDSSLRRGQSSIEENRSIYFQPVRAFFLL